MMPSATAAEIAGAVQRGETSAEAEVAAALDRIARHNTAIGAFTDVIAERALAKAGAVDPSLPLAGVPFAVKNLFDLAGLATRAGSKIQREAPPAAADATLVQKLEAAGAICVGALNMGEYAYDFTGENIHDGPSRNPHDLARMTGGSSGGSGAAVAAGLVPLSLGSDTNGSIRVPASLCGLFGLKPTYGRLSRHGTFPFVSAFDHLGPLARSVEDLALSYDAMQGYDPADPAQTPRPPEPVVGEIERGVAGLRVSIAGGYFTGDAEPRAAVEHVAAALGVTGTLDVPDADVARAAAFLITMVEGAALHLERLRTRAADFDPAVRDRLIAGAMLPSAWVVDAQKVRRAFRETMLGLFEQTDILLAPATPLRAPLLGQQTAVIGGEEMAVRPNMGIFTQPISFVGLPVMSVPVWLTGETLPIGVQVIGPPWREDLVLRVARDLERNRVVAAPVAKDFAHG